MVYIYVSYVADLDRSQQAPQQSVRHSYHMNSGPPAYHIYPPEHHLIPKSQPVTLIRGGMVLAKRPTIEGLDKRKSWSLDISSSSPSRVSSSLNSIVSAQNSLTASNTIGSSQSGSVKSGRISSYQNTDGLVGIGARADNTGKSTGTDPRNRKKPVPLPRSKLPAAEKVSSPSPQTPQSSSSKFFQRSKTDLGSDALSKYKAKKLPSPSSGSKYPAPRVPMFNRPVPQKRSVPVSTSPTISEVPLAESKAAQKAASQRPVLKEKPAFSTFKTKSKKSDHDDLKSAALKSTLLQEARMMRAASEGDILGQLIEEETLKGNENVIKKESEKTQGAAAPDKKVSKFDVVQLKESDFKKLRSEPLTITSAPLVDKTSHENVAEWMDKSCSTSFESNESSSMLTTERSTDVSMEEQDLFSLESCVVQNDSGQDRLLMSPCSTTSRSPPSPVQGMTPKRQVGCLNFYFVCRIL